ncbi:type IV secretory system conjugative DNA transfer family protein [Baekduia sp.]|jgi:hypothetical protein|uniref:type IV secretory system conjugative DNA transfer family protein n=1 Tax=Baekduia sp. TaxID=2600305 RepID=UPI002E089DD7|nr:DUF87 domain-containing protein [Baekduia sp.]
MSAELVPAALAVCGGAGLVAAVAAYETRRAAEMRAGRVRLGVRFPLGTESSGAMAALRGLSGLGWRQEMVFEVRGRERRISHALLISDDLREVVAGGLAAALPGIRLETDDAPSGLSRYAIKLFVPTPLVLHEGEIEHGSRSVLAGFTQLRSGEEMVLRWAVMPSRPRTWSPADGNDSQEDKAAVRLWQRKVSSTGFQVSGLLLVHAASRTRARQLAHGVVSAVHARENRVGVVKATSDARGRSLSGLPRVTRSSGWLSLGELLPILGWPLGDELVPGLELGGVRERPVPAGVPRTGRVIFIGRDNRGERPVALSPEAARHHMAVVGPTGSGKSSLIGRSILSDIRAGHGGVVIDPKHDLIEDLLRRVDPRDADRIVVIDPADARPSPALDVLGVGDPDLRSDVLLGALSALFKSSTGIRTEVYGRLALRTLAEVPNATLADVGRLFGDASFRRQAIARVSDPYVRSQWAAFDALSTAAQIEHVQSPMSKVTALVSRPAIRAVLASPQATVDVGQLLAARKWLLVSLAPGRIGEPAARLLGAILMYEVWSAIEARSAIPANERHPLFIYLDELTTVAALPVGLEALLERSRGLGAGVTVGVQSLARIPEGTRAALLGNAATLLTFRAGADEAKRLAREMPGLSERDVQALGPFEVGARIGVGAGSHVAVVTGRSLPWPQETGMAESIRDRSADAYGAPAPVTEDEGPAGDIASDEASSIGRRRRMS